MVGIDHLSSQLTVQVAKTQNLPGNNAPSTISAWRNMNVNELPQHPTKKENLLLKGKSKSLQGRPRSAHHYLIQKRKKLIFML
jgi:hypothetical protein